MVLKISENDESTFSNVDNAIKYMYNTGFTKEIIVYDINSKQALLKTQRIYDTIEEYNKFKPLDIQILPTYPYSFRGIIGCLGVQCYSIGLGTYKMNHNRIAVMSGWNEYVLDTSKEKADVTPSLKALSSLFLLFSFD